MSDWTTKQQPPFKEGGEPVLPMVLEEVHRLEGYGCDKQILADIHRGLELRAVTAPAKYGVEMCTNNGRVPSIDALQECADLVQYLGQDVMQGAPAREEFDTALRLLYRLAERRRAAFLGRNAR